MSRPTAVPYHQCVYDLLDLEPGDVSADAVAMIESHEAEYGPLPAAVREWYTVPGLVSVSREPDGRTMTERVGQTWLEWCGGDDIAFLSDLLGDFAAATPTRPLRFCCVASSQDGNVSWWVDPHGGDDPPVWAYTDRTDTPDTRRLVASVFSGFLLTWLAGHHAARHPSSIGPSWLAAPAAPVPLPVFDFLTDRLGPPTEFAVSSGVTQYRYHAPDGEVRVTADSFAHPMPHAAWWLASPTADGLARLRSLLDPWDVFGPAVLTSADDHAGRL